MTWRDEVKNKLLLAHPEAHIEAAALHSPRFCRTVTIG